MQNLFKAQQPFAFLLGQLRNRNAGPGGNYFGDILRRYLSGNMRFLLFSRLALLVKLLFQLCFLISEPCRALKVLSLDSLVLIGVGSGNFSLKFLFLLRHFAAAETNP